MEIDIVIPVAAKDYPKLSSCVQSIITHSLTPIRKIHVISESDIALIGLSVKQPLVHIKDADFPFTKEDIEALFAKKGCVYAHSSWYYQQLLKFYIFRVIPDLLPHVLILDADYSFTKDVEFLTANDKFILSSGYPFKWLLNTKTYPTEVTHIHAEFAKRLLPGWFPADAFSGMQHHMLFHRDIIDEIFSLAENTHGMEFWQAFIENVELTKWNAASEYVIYYHYVMNNHRDAVVTRHLTACDIIYDSKDKNLALEKAAELRKQPEFYAVGCHGFLDLAERIKTMDYIPTDLKTQMLSEQTLMFKLILNDGVLQIDSMSSTAS